MVTRSQVPRVVRPVITIMIIMTMIMTPDNVTNTNPEQRAVTVGVLFFGVWVSR